MTRPSRAARVALITGGTRSIGRAIALRLARDGFVPVVNFRDDEAAAARAVTALRKFAPRALMLRADVTDPAQAASLLQTVLDRFGRLDALVNNVGPLLYKNWFETSPEEWQAMFAGNLHSAFYCTRAAVPAMRAAGGGAVVNIGSPAAAVVRGVPNATAYAIAKTGLIQFSKSVARTEGRHGIRANVVSPGYVQTEEYPPPADRAAMIAQVPLGRLGTPEEIAAAVAWLVSPEAAYVNGAVVDVGGGLWA